MKKLLLSVFIAVSCMAEAQDRMTPELLWSLKRVSGEGMSQDGRTALFAVRTYDMGTEKSTTKRYSVDVKSGRRKERSESREIFQRDKAAWYAMDDKAIYRSEDNGSNWRSVLAGTEGMENVRISPDGRYVAYTREVLIRPVLGTDIHPDLKKNTAQIYTDLNYRHWDTWEDGKYSHVFIRPVSGGKEKDLMAGEPYDAPQKPFGGLEDIVWSPDSRSLVYVTKKKYGKEYAKSTNTDLYQYHVETGETVNLTANMDGYDMNPSFSPDGRYIAWTSMAHEGFEADKNDIFIMETNTKTASRMNITESWDGTVNSFAWGDDNRSIYFVAPWKGTEHLFEASFSTMGGNRPAAKVRSNIRQITSGSFDVSGIVGQSGNELVVSRTDMNHANELYVTDIRSGAMRQLTHENDEAYSRIKMSNTELR
ncbi:MAG: S9 family peptidase, partial [Sphingobacteriales bacterium]